MQIARVQQLAREGITRQGGQTFDNARKVGDTYLSAIANEAGGSLDGIVARTAQDACARRMYSQSAYEGQNRALKALAAGVGGPIGPVLASIGRDSMHKTIWHDAQYAYHDGRSMGESYLDAIKAYSENATERELAGAARAATRPSMLNQSAFQVQSEALQRIQSGVQNQDPAKALASFGRAARMRCQTNPDARAVGSPILNAIARNGDTRQNALANTACTAAARKLRQDVANLAQDVGFCKILEAPKGTIAQDLADLGTRALGHCSYAEDQRELGHGVLEGVARYAEDPGVRKFAQVANDTVGSYLYHFSGAGAAYDAFNVLASGETDAEKLMARFGLKVIERGQTIEDSRNMGQVVLEALCQNATDEVKKGVLDSAVAQARTAGAQTAAGVQRFAFNWVLKAPDLPKPSQDTGATLDQGLLEQRIGLHENIKTLLEEEVNRLNAEVAGKQTRMHDLADRFNPLVPIDHKLLRHHKIARYAMFAGAGVFLAGMLVPGLSSGVQTAMFLGGGATGMVSLLAQGSISARRKQVLEKYWPLRNAYDQLNGEQQALQGAVGATRAMMGPIEQAIAKDQGSLEVIKLGSAVKPPSTTTIEIDRDMVTIGGVRINRARPKERKGEDQNAPAVPGPD